jgi:hypothetical protein
MALWGLVLVVAVAASALAVFGRLTNAASAHSSAVASDRAMNVSLDLNRYLTDASPALDATLEATIKAFGQSGGPAALDASITAATHATFTMVIWPYRAGALADDPSMDKYLVAGNTDGAVTDVFEGHIADAGGDPVSGAGDLIGVGPVLFAGRPFQLGGRNGYVLISAPLGLKSLDSMAVTTQEQGSQDERSLPHGAVQLDFGDLPVDALDSALYVPSEATPTVYATVADLESGDGGRIVLTPPRESLDQVRSAAEQPYLFSMLAAIAVGVLLGFPALVVFGQRVEQALPADAPSVD